MATITLRIDDLEKKELDKLLDNMGLNISTFYNIYTKKVLSDHKIPFEISENIDPFYSSANQAQIKKADAQAASGNVVVKTIEELDAMANETL